MKKSFFRSYKLMNGLLSIAMLAPIIAQAATPIWHCSRSAILIADASEHFALANLNIQNEIIQISLRDLHSVYQGKEVSTSGKSFSACVTSESELTKLAMDSIGVSPQSVFAMARHRTLSPRNIYLAANEQAMTECITSHHPAIGYLSEIRETETIGPCF